LFLQFGLGLGLNVVLVALLRLLADSVHAIGLNVCCQSVLVVVTVVGVLMSLIANPLAGDLSDRTLGPWDFGGSLTEARAVGDLPYAGLPLALVIVSSAAKFGLNASMAGINGSAADRISPALQAGLRGCIGAAQPLGLVVGVALWVWHGPFLLRRPAPVTGVTGPSAA
jgi:hypothetical protein